MKEEITLIEGFNALQSQRIADGIQRLQKGELTRAQARKELRDAEKSIAHFQARIDYFGKGHAGTLTERITAQTVHSALDADNLAFRSQGAFTENYRVAANALGSLYRARDSASERVRVIAYILENSKGKRK